MNTPKIVTMPSPEYRKAPGVSKSDLDLISRSPAHFRYGVREETDAMRIGTLVHQAVFDQSSLSYSVKPEGMSFATKDGKAWRADHEGTMIITQKESDMLVGIVESIKRHPKGGKLIAEGLAEQSLFAMDSNGTLRKGRTDFLPAKTPVILDLKTCEDARPGKFSRSILDYRYHVQAAYYLDLCKLIGEDRRAFILIAAEKTPPYAVMVYQVQDEDVEFGRMCYQRDLQVYRNCMESGIWPSYSEEIELIGIPEYAKQELEEIL